MMTLEEAIKHCKDVALSCTNKECALEHFQLLKWLQEYSNMLEKQAEHANFRSKIQVGDRVTRNEDGVLVNLSQLDRISKQGNNMGISETTKQKLEDNLNKALEKETPESWNKFLDGGEQKPAAKYKIGDTIYYNSFGRLVSFVIANIVEDGTGNPMYEDKDGNSVFQNDIVERKPAFEMITPEKSLSIDSDTYNKIVDECIYGEQKPVCSEEQHEKESLSDIENRIINFAMQFHDNRMKPEAEWEDEVKMLRDNIKIDPWSEEDERFYNQLNKLIYSAEYCRERQEKSNWLKSLKDRIQPQPKQEWSEEDVRKMRAIVTIINSTPQSIICSIDQDRESLCNWLKSLRPQNRWKPSDEQMNAFDAVLVYNPPCSNECRNHLITLYNDLKKLKGE